MKKAIKNPITTGTKDLNALLESAMKIKIPRSGMMKIARPRSRQCSFLASL